MKFLFSSFLLFSITAVSASLEKLKIGWQVPWATQGQIVQVLKHTDILKKNGIEAEFVGRTYGPLLNELALAGEIDVVLTADQPAIVLFSKKKGWRAVGRLMYNRTLTYVPPASAIKSIQDLKGKKIGIPIGAAAERVTLDALRRADLDPKKDVKIVNLGIREQGPLVSRGGLKAQKWGPFDALSGFDPVPAIFQSKKLVKVLDIGKVVSMVLMNDQLIQKKPRLAEKMMQSIYDAYDYYRKNKKQANQWFLKESGLKNADQKACNIAAEIEPNLFVKKRSEMNLKFSKADMQVVKGAALFLKPKIGAVDVEKFVDNKYVKNLK